MNQILVLREKRAKAWEAAKAFLDTKRGADGLISAEDSATYDKMEADVVSVAKIMKEENLCLEEYLEKYK